MNTLEDKIDEITFEEYIEQYDNFRTEFTPKILKEMEEKEYSLEVCCIGLCTIVDAMINMFGNDVMRKECIKIIEGELNKATTVISDGKKTK